MSRVVVDYNSVETFVDEQTQKGNDVSWDGWTLVFFKQNPNGFNDRNGAFKDGKWGVKARVDVDRDGLWKIPVKYVSTRRKAT